MLKTIDITPPTHFPLCPCPKLCCRPFGRSGDDSQWWYRLLTSYLIIFLDSKLFRVALVRIGSARERVRKHGKSCKPPEQWNKSTRPTRRLEEALICKMPNIIQDHPIGKQKRLAKKFTKFQGIYSGEKECIPLDQQYSYPTPKKKNCRPIAVLVTCSLSRPLCICLLTDQSILIDPNETRKQP